MYGHIHSSRKKPADRLVAGSAGKGQPWAGIHHRLTPPAPADLPEIRSTLDWLDGQSTVEDEKAGHGNPRFLQALPGRGGWGSF